MNRKLLCLLTAAVLMAGCAQGAASSSQPESSDSPVYSYVNPNPDMVLVKAPGGDVTYADWRLYMDVTEQINRYSARQQLGIGELVTQDLAQMGVTVDEEAFTQMAAQNVMMMSLYTPSLAQEMDKVSELTGLSVDALNVAMQLDYRLEYLSGLLSEHFYALAKEKYPAAPADQSSSGPVSSSPQAESALETSQPEQDAASSADPAAEAEQARQQAIENEVAAMFEEYSGKLGDRQSLEDESVLITVDGNPIPYTQQHRDYIEYTAISNRVNAASFIQSGELVLRELTRRGTDIPREEFDATLQQYIGSIKGEAVFMEELAHICAKFGATTDDYFKALERPLWFQHVADVYYNLMTEEYNALPEDAQNKPESAEAYYAEQFNTLLEGSETVNIAG